MATKKIFKKSIIINTIKIVVKCLFHLVFRTLYSNYMKKKHGILIKYVCVYVCV